MDGIGNFISMMDYILDTKRKKTYHRRHSVECLFTFRWACAYRYDNSERGGRR